MPHNTERQRKGTPANAQREVDGFLYSVILHIIFILLIFGQFSFSPDKNADEKLVSGRGGGGGGGNGNVKGRSGYNNSGIESQASLLSIGSSVKNSLAINDLENSTAVDIEIVYVDKTSTKESSQEKSTAHETKSVQFEQPSSLQTKTDVSAKPADLNSPQPTASAFPKIVNYEEMKKTLALLAEQQLKRKKEREALELQKRAMSAAGGQQVSLMNSVANEGAGDGVKGINPLGQGGGEGTGRGEGTGSGQGSGNGDGESPYNDFVNSEGKCKTEVKPARDHAVRVYILEKPCERADSQNPCIIDVDITNYNPGRFVAIYSSMPARFNFTNTELVAKIYLVGANLQALGVDPDKLVIDSGTTFNNLSRQTNYIPESEMQTFNESKKHYENPAYISWAQKYRRSESTINATELFNKRILEINEIYRLHYYISENYSEARCAARAVSTYSDKPSESNTTHKKITVQ